MKKAKTKNLILLAILSGIIFSVLLLFLLEPIFLNLRGPFGVYSTVDKSLVLDFENNTGKLKNSDGETIDIAIKTASNYQIISLYDKRNEYSEKGFLGAYRVDVERNGIILKENTGDKGTVLCLNKELN